MQNKTAKQNDEQTRKTLGTQEAETGGHKRKLRNQTNHDGANIDDRLTENTRENRPIYKQE